MTGQWFVPVLISALLAGCADSGADQSDERAGIDATGAVVGRAIPIEDPSIRGVVTAAGNGSLQVETDPSEVSGSPKAIIRLMPNATISYRNGEAADEHDITVGKNVSVWFEGPVAESYPVQASTSTVVIEPAGEPAAP